MTAKLVTALACFMLGGVAWSSTCNDLREPARSPVEGVEIYFDLHAGSDDDPKKRLKVSVPNAGTASKVSTSEQFLIGSPLHGKPVAGLPPFREPYVWGNAVDPRKYDAKSLRDVEGWIYVYEPDPRNGRRLCRLEQWEHRSQELDINQKRVAREKVLALTGPVGGEKSPILAKLSETYRRIAVKHYVYNVAGQIDKYLESRPIYTGDVATQWKTTTQACFFYDGKGWPSRNVEPYNDGTPTSCESIREGDGAFRDYFYDPSTGAYRGFRHSHGLSFGQRAGNPGPVWEVEWQFVAEEKNGVRVAFADAKRQLYLFAPGLELESVPLPRPRSAADIDHAYYFYEPLPLSFMDGPGDPEKKLKQYHRERRREFAGEVYISEYFAANGGLQHRIWWRGMDWAVFRHEQYDAQGKLKRVINRGLANEGHTYYAESAGYKSQFAQRPYLLHRVYEYDKAGKESLVAISWFNHDPEIDHPQRTPGRGGALVDLAKDAKRAWADRNKPKPAVKEELKQFYGTPDGKVKWKDAESFGKAFGIFWEFKDMDRFVEAKRRAEGLPKGSRIE